MFHKMPSGDLPCIPSGVRVYAVGDVHGRADLLARVFAAIEQDQAVRPVERSLEVYVGDYIDRGPDSRGVVEMLLRRMQQREVMCLRGNHETYALMPPHEEELFLSWLKLGGLETLLSYSVEVSDADLRQPKFVQERFLEALPVTHRLFFERLPVRFICGDYFFVHAGVRPGVALEAQNEQDMLWIRKEFHQSRENFGKIIVHGHTPVREPAFEINRINIDTGAFATGRLTCLVLEEDQAVLLGGGGMVSASKSL